MRYDRGPVSPGSAASVGGGVRGRPQRRRHFIISVAQPEHVSVADACPECVKQRFQARGRKIISNFWA